MNQPPVALTIAGSDSGGGAGIQADLKTFAAHRVFGASALTAVTVQDTQHVYGIHPLPTQLVADQIDVVLEDLPVSAVKTGMLADPTLIELLAERDLPNLVVDPVLVSSSGTSLFPTGMSGAYRALFARATVVTPNLAEAGAILGAVLATVDEMADAARALAKSGARCVVVKGGHLEGDAVDVVWFADEITLLRAPRIRTNNGHGTGCTLASAIAANLALGLEIPAAVAAAKKYVTRALEGSADWRLGSGRGPLSWKEM